MIEETLEQQKTGRTSNVLGKSKNSRDTKILLRDQVLLLLKPPTPNWKLCVEGLLTFDDSFAVYCCPSLAVSKRATWRFGWAYHLSICFGNNSKCFPQIIYQQLFEKLQKSFKLDHLIYKRWKEKNIDKDYLTATTFSKKQTDRTFDRILIDGKLLVQKFFKYGRFHSEIVSCTNSPENCSIYDKVPQAFFNSANREKRKIFWTLCILDMKRFKKRDGVSRNNSFHAFDSVSC